MAPMANALAPSVTTRDPKGLKFISIVEGAYNKAGLSDDEAQNVNEAPGLADLIDEHISRNRYPNRFGEYLRETGELSIPMPALKRPTLKELQANNDWIKSIERDTSTEEAVILTLATALVPDDGNSIDGKEYEKRIALKHNSLLGFQHRQWLLEHQDEFPELKALLGKIYIDFPGIVVVNRDGSRGVPYCGRSGSRWDGGWRWLGDEFGVDGRIAFGK
jgi:hypothetical protein